MGVPELRTHLVCFSHKYIHYNMPSDYLHQHEEFSDLLQIIGRDNGILPSLVEKDYWIMHVLYGLKKQGFEFELKGGTSLSKGYGIIDRFSEDIDIHIKPHAELRVDEKKQKEKAIQSRKDYYDWLAQHIRIDGIVSVVRDHGFYNVKTYMSGGIRLNYESYTEKTAGVKDGILLEAGFDRVTPNKLLTITSWAYQKAVATGGVAVKDNRAIDIACYHPGYTFVEKLQTIATKYRQELTDGIERHNLMRQYYDVYSLLQHEDVLAFIGTKEYQLHKEDRFPKVDFEIPLMENEAFILSNADKRNEFKKRYQNTAALYYTGQPDFEMMLEEINKHINRL